MKGDAIVTQGFPALKDQYKHLEHLQELDLKIENLKKKKTAIPSAMKAIDEQWGKASAALQMKKGAFSELEKFEKQAKAAIELNSDRLSRAKGKLEQVHNSQEFQAANKEIDQLNKSNTDLEAQLKKNHEEQEAMKKDMAALQDTFNKVDADRKAQVEVNQKENGSIDGEIKTLTDQRTQYTTHIERRVLSLYDRVRNAKAGIGFTPAVGGRCSACNMVVPPQLYIQVQKMQEVHSCPACHRILFVPGLSAAPVNG